MSLMSQFMSQLVPDDSLFPYDIEVGFCNGYHPIDGGYVDSEEFLEKEDFSEDGITVRGFSKLKNWKSDPGDWTPSVLGVFMIR